MKNGKGSLFEARLQAALKAQPRAELPSGFAARLRAKAEAITVSPLFQEKPYYAASITAVLSRANLFIATALFIASFAAGSIYGNTTHSSGVGLHTMLQSEASGQDEDPLLNSLYYAHQRVL